MNNYVFEIAKGDRQILGKIIKAYTHFWSKGERIELRMGDLVDTYDLDRLAREIRLNMDDTYSDQDEGVAVKNFLAKYDEMNEAALAESKKQASKVAFMEANSKAQQYFSGGNFELAVEQFNKAFEFTDWDDQNHWMEQSKLRRWQALLEIAYASPGAKQRKFFDEARKIAGTEAKIKELIAKADMGVASDQAQFESSYCLFYYLLWASSAQQDERSQIEEIFRTHYTIASGVVFSGQSSPIVERCNELKSKMHL